MTSLRADNPSPMTLDGTVTYVVGRARRVLIDPGPADPRHLRALTRTLAGSQLVAILLTHRHPDHSAAAAALREATGASVYAAGETDAAESETVAVDETLDEGQRFETDAGALRVIPTPGHCADHVAFSWDDGEDAAAVFVGDLVLGIGETALVAWPEGDVSAYLGSLERIARLEPKILFPAHGPPLTEPSRSIAAYRRHRIRRLEQTLDALRSVGEASAGELVDAVYREALDPRLRWAAEGSVRASLEHLLERGRVERRGADRFAAPTSSVPQPRSGE